MPAIRALISLPGSVLLLVACQGAPRARPEGPAVPFDRQTARREVYEAVLRDVYLRPDTKRFVIDPATTAAEYIVGVGVQLPGARASTVADYLEQKQPGVMPRDLAPGVPVVWFSMADWESLPVPQPDSWMGTRWEAFRAKYPDSGWIRFSEVGFSGDGTEAIVSAEYGADSLAGAGQLLLLKKGPQGWRVAGKQPTWIA